MFTRGDVIRVRGDGFLPNDPGAEFIPGGTEGVIDQMNKGAGILLVDFGDDGVVSVDLDGSTKLFDKVRGAAKGGAETTVPAEPARRKEHQMSDKSGIGDTINMVKERGFHGGKVAAADEAGEFLLEIAAKFLGDAYPGLLETERGKEFGKLFAATGLHYIATAHPDFVPGAEHVAEACGLQVEAAGRDLIQPILAGLRPAIAGLARIGAASEDGKKRTASA